MDDEAQAIESAEKKTTAKKAVVKKKAAKRANVGGKKKIGKKATVAKKKRAKPDPEISDVKNQKVIPNFYIGDTVCIKPETKVSEHLMPFQRRRIRLRIVRELKRVYTQIIDNRLFLCEGTDHGSRVGTTACATELKLISRTPEQLRLLQIEKEQIEAQIAISLQKSEAKSKAKAQAKAEAEAKIKAEAGEAVEIGVEDAAKSVQPPTTVQESVSPEMVEHQSPAC